MVNKELVAASSKPIILSILSKGESYGYEIIQSVKDASSSQLEWTDGMLYPVLHKLEKKNLIVSEWRVSQSGRKRKYYSITSGGKKLLHEERAEWNAVNTTLAKLWNRIPSYGKTEF